MAKAIFKALLTLIFNVVSILLLPVNLLVQNAFPDFSSWITTFNNYLNIIANQCYVYYQYFMYIFPSEWILLFRLYLLILIAKYTVSFSIHMIIKVIEIIKAVKIW